MEFHIARTLRDQLGLKDVLFSYTGNVVFADVRASRDLAQKLTEQRTRQDGGTLKPARVVNAGALFAMGLIDELSHAMIQQYREEMDPAVLRDARAWMVSQSDAETVDKLLLRFTEQFPAMAVYRGEQTAEQWLAGETAGLPNRDAALEELLLLWLANGNAAFHAFSELFDDRGLRQATAYTSLTDSLPEYFAGRPEIAPEIGSLLDALRAPALASPDSLTGQLDYIRRHWTRHLGPDVKRVLLAVDTLREEDLAIWARFNPPAPDHHRHVAPGFGGEGFVGDEYMGFEDAWVTGPDGVRRRVQRVSVDFQASLVEYEAFSQDQAWMPTVVLMAKSTYVWLEQLSRKYGRHIHRLDQIPDEELRILQERGMTGLWLIGLWERSIASRTIKHLRGQGDAVASAYSLKEYNIAEDLGGNTAYENLRDRAARFGVRLASDMVPNHMGIDSPWVIEHPDWFVTRPDSPFPSYTFNGPDLSTDPRAEIKLDDHYFDQTDAAVVFRLRTHADGQTRYIFHGNDGTTFAWNDTAQLDYSKAYVREQVMQAILHVARLFPIIRFDAAMVLAKRHVQRLWFPLPGQGGSIPSRAENALTQEEFDAIMPVEFWREVVDRVAAEVPGTLLLAEAFWMLEGYFVRTLGMHRVYNSAFMNMLRDEENAKYRSYLKKTMEFDPDILKRYVNFMSNPDERTTIDQFGSGDKCFGVATLMSTLPGLPMFGHGQIEGYGERYGMEFKKPKFEEWPNEGLVARHQREIAPLLHKRYLFAESTHFVLYDFWTGNGNVDENVFAYSNQSEATGTLERALVLYNNSYNSTYGTVRTSVASMDKGSGELRQPVLSEGLSIPDEGELFFAFRDNNRKMEYIRRATDLIHHGFSVSLRGYEYVVLTDWRSLRASAEKPWDRLCDSLNGAGVYSLEEAVTGLHVRPLHEKLRAVLAPDVLGALSQEVENLQSADPLDPETRLQALAAAREDSPEYASVPKTMPEPSESAETIPAGNAAGSGPLPPSLAELQSRLEGFFTALQEFVPAAAARDQTLNPPAVQSTPLEQALARVLSALELPRLAERFSAAWPERVAAVIPGTTRGERPERIWAPVLAYVVLRGLPHVQAFDALQMRQGLAEIFSGLGLEGQESWRAAARVRLLLAYGSTGPDALQILRSEAFLGEGDTRWLAGVSEHNGTVYLNREQWEELICWMALQSLLQPDAQQTLPTLEAQMETLHQVLAEAGYEVSRFQQTAVEADLTPGESEQMAEAQPEPEAAVEVGAST